MRAWVTERRRALIAGTVAVLAVGAVLALVLTNQSSPASLSVAPTLGPSPATPSVATPSAPSSDTGTPTAPALTGLPPIIDLGGSQPATPGQGGGSSTDYPAAPTNLRISVNEYVVRLHWTDNSDGESGFHIAFSGPQGVTSVFVGGGPDATSFEFPPVPPGWAACFAIRSFRTSGSGYFASEWSPGTHSNVCVSIPRRQPPAPTNVTVTAYSTEVNVKWMDHSDGIPTFRIELTGASSQLLYSTTKSYRLGVPATTEVGAEYCFRVQAIVTPENAGLDQGESPWSERVCATTLPGPAMPSGVTATATSHDTVVITWVDNSSIESGYRVVRIGYVGGPNLPANSTSYEWTGLTADTEYCFQVASTLGGVHAWAPRVCARTFAAP